MTDNLPDSVDEYIHPKSTSHDGKKVMSEKEAAEVVLNKPWYRYYKCQYCPAFHLTKEMNPHLWHKKNQQNIIDAAIRQAFAEVLELLPERQFERPGFVRAEAFNDCLDQITALLKRRMEKL